MNTQEIYDKLKEEFGDKIISLTAEESSDPFITVDSSAILDISLSLRDSDKFKFDYMMCLSGVDAGEQFEVVYHLYSMELKHTLVFKAMLPKEEAKIQTVEKVWRTADWHEREAYDMFGIIFEGHHNLIRILNPYDWEGYPLRKDYKEPETYHGIKVPY